MHFCTQHSCSRYRDRPRAQVASTIIAAVGFNGYPWPPEGVNNCQFCQLSTGSHHPIFSRQAPLFGTESAWTDSTIGCLCACLLLLAALHVQAACGYHHRAAAGVLLPVVRHSSAAGDKRMSRSCQHCCRTAQLVMHPR